MRVRASCQILVALALAACGGGGGGPGEQPAGNQAQVSSGLVPAAPPAGDVLYADAAPLRPLLPGARWIYREQIGIEAGNERTVTQSAGAGGAISETSSDVAGAQTLQVAADRSITVAFSLPLGGSVAVDAAGIELATPVRQNAQYVLLDRRVADSGVDVDGDGVRDALDIALWSRVIGNETLLIEGRAAPQTVLRVDSWIALRFVPSKGGPPATSQRRASTWFAPGIGIVREVFRDEDDSTLTSDERLTGFDGGTFGVGAFVNRQQGDLFRPHAAPWSAVPLEDGALAMSPRIGGLALLRIDKRGMVTAAHPIEQGGRPVQPIAVLSFAGELRMLTGSGSAPDLVALDREGAVVGTAPLARLETSVDAPAGVVSEWAHLAVARPGAAVAWYTWRRTYQPAIGLPWVDEVVLRRFDAAGRWVGNEIRLPAGPGVTAIWPTATDGGIAVTWAQPDFGAGGQRYPFALLRDDGSVVATRDLRLTDPSQFSTTPGWIAGPGGLWLTWRGPDGPGGEPGDPRAFCIDSSGAVAGSSGDLAAALAANVAGFPAELRAAWSRSFSAYQGRWFVAATSFDRLFDGDPRGPRNTLSVAEFDPSCATGAALRRVLSMRLPVQASLPPIAFPDRLLLLADDGGVLRTVVVWR